MSLVNADTGEVLADITAEDARDLTDKIKVTVEGAWHLIVAAYTQGAHRALGYASWDDYTLREFGTSRLRLPREERQEVVASLRDSGLSMRAIAAAAGVDRKTVRGDLAKVGEKGPPARNMHDVLDDLERIVGMRDEDLNDLDEADDHRGGAEPSTDAPSRIAEPSAGGEPRPASGTPITGTDGKRYSAPIPKPKPKRSSLNDSASKAGWEFRKATERLERIVADDRFSANRQQVAAHLRGHLTYAVEVLADLLDALDNEPQEAR